MSVTQRLNKYKARASKSPYQSDWRMHRYGSPFKDLGPVFSWSQDGTNLFTDEVNSLGVLVGDSSDLIRMNHTGWFCDHDQHYLCKGAVVKMHTSRGTYYIPVAYTHDGCAFYHMDDKVLVTKDEHDHSDTISEVARIADGCAEIHAEKYRQSDIEARAENTVEDLHQEIAIKRLKIKSLIAAVRVSEPLEARICEYLKAGIRDLLSQCREHYAQARRLKGDPWSVIHD